MLQIGITAGLLVLAVSLHQCKPRIQEATSLLVKNGPVKSHHPFICLKDKIEEWQMKREKKDPLWNRGVNLAAVAELIRFT